MAEPRFYGVIIGGGLFHKFGAGVDFFFVLSGFIIAWAHWGDIGRPDRLGRYAVRRFRRIYPPYWGVLLPLSLAYFLFPAAGIPSQHDPVNFVFSFLLLPYPLPPILGVAWTLVFEMIFYVIFGLVILVGRVGWWALAAWGLAVLVANTAFAALPFPLSVLLDVHNIEFLLGIVAAWALRHHRVPAPAMLAIVGSALFVAQMLSKHPLLDDPLVGRLGYGIAAAMAMLGVVELERTRGLAVPWILRQLGAASYSIYLIHGVAISFGVQVATRLVPRSVPLGLVAIGLILTGVAAGIVYHHLAEKPLTRLMRDGWRRKAPAEAPDVG